MSASISRSGNVHPDPETAAWEASEKEKWDALNAHLTPQFEGVRPYIEHASAKYRAGVVGNPRLATVPDPDSPEMRSLLKDNLAAEHPELVEQFRKLKNKNIRDELRLGAPPRDSGRASEPRLNVGVPVG